MRLANQIQNMALFIGRNINVLFAHGFGFKRGASAMAFEHYIISGQKRLRCGFTTGSCAALASMAACRLLLSGSARKQETLITGENIKIEADIESAGLLPNGRAVCAVRKDAGDDCDVTDGLLIFAEVYKTESGIFIDGGQGIGRVTLKGLDQPVGAAAINSSPRRMIKKAVREVCHELGYDEGIAVIISAPKGEEAAAQTFNPALGITGGISILGTTGIVRPQSLAAMRESIELEIGVRRKEGFEQLVLTPGNYGERFLKKLSPPPNTPVVTCANFVGAGIDCAAANGFKRLLLVSHIGKAVKIAGGVFDTHSRTADCRREIFTAHAALCGAKSEVAGALMQSASTEECIGVLLQSGLFERVMASLCTSIGQRLEQRAGSGLLIGAAVFFEANNHGGRLLFKTAGAERIMREWKTRL